MSVANPLWGAPRIHGELVTLGIDIGQTSVNFNHDRHLNHRDIFKQNRSAALAEWRQLAAGTPQTSTLRRPAQVCLTMPGGELNAEIERHPARNTTIMSEKPLGKRGAVMADTLGEAWH
jgi:hypothetical protein